jgi:hypothetical protein
MLRVLTLKQPYASEIMSGAKVTEHRTWACAAPQTILVHAGLKGPSWLPHGVILGAVDVLACEGSPGDYEWRLADPRPLARPIACPGSLGLWKPSAAILAALPADLQALAAAPALALVRVPPQPQPLPDRKPPRGCRWLNCPRCGRALAVNLAAVAAVCEHCWKCFELVDVARAAAVAAQQAPTTNRVRDLVAVPAAADLVAPTPF